MIVVPEEFHESVKFHDSPSSKPNFLSQLQELYYIGLSDPCGKFLKTSAIMTGIYSLNAKIVAAAMYGVEAAEVGSNTIAPLTAAIINVFNTRDDRHRYDWFSPQ